MRNPEEILISVITNTKKPAQDINVPLIADISRFIPDAVVLDVDAKKNKEQYDKQIVQCNSFINHESVQSRIRDDFNNKKHTLFDPSDGDNMCESRIFLLEIFDRNQNYEALTPEEKLVISLCHALRLYQIAIYDEYDLEVASHERPKAIAYPPIKGNRLVAVTQYNTKGSIYDAVSLMSHAISAISAQYVRDLASYLNINGLLDDLTVYHRLKNCNGRQILYPAQVKAAPLAYTMLSSLSILDVPIIYKITRLQSDAGKFMLQGIEMVAFRHQDGKLAHIDISKVEGDKPNIIFSGQSIYKPSISVHDDTLLSTFRQLGECTDSKTFASRFAEIVDDDQSMLSSLIVMMSAIHIDKKRGNGSTYQCSALNDIGSKIDSNIETFFGSQSYLTKGGSSIRNDANITLQFCHVYINSINAETKRIAELTNNSSAVSCNVENKYFRNMSGDLTVYK